MMKSMKKSVTVMMLAVVLLFSMAASAFANPYNSYNYYFEYSGNYHPHSSSYINANATESGGEVTLTLSGNYFPQVEVDGDFYLGVYNATTNTTTLTFPGSLSANIDVQLNVVAGPHNAWYPLTIIWG